MNSLKNETKTMTTLREKLSMTKNGCTTQLTKSLEKTRFFNHRVLELGYEDLVTESSERTGRLYCTPDGNRYPSVTTVLSILSEDAIREWRQRVGPEEANRVSRVASSRGTHVHNVIEKYLRNDETYLDGASLVAQANFKSIKPIIDERIGDIWALEIPLYSDYLNIAGRCDCIAEWDGVLSIVDWKTSGRIKEKDDIHSYFIQKAAYAIMFEERTGKPIVNLVTAMTVDNEEPLIFKEHRDNWAPKLLETIAEYKRRKLFGHK